MTGEHRCEPRFVPEWRAGRPTKGYWVYDPCLDCRRLRPEDRYWILLYDPGLDRQIAVFRDAPSLEAAREAAVTDTGLEVIAAGLYRRGDSHHPGAERIAD